MRFPRLFLAAFLFALTIPSLNAGPYSTIYSFGDSLSDTGNLYASFGIPAAPYSNGRFTNGPVWVQDLATSLGVGPVTPSLAGGNDFAVGGAQTGSNAPLGYKAGAGDLTAQLTAFNLAHASADPNALYTVWIGANDLLSILGSNPTPLQASNDVTASITNIDNFLLGLKSDGAKNILLLTVPDLGATPRLNGNPLVSAAASQLTNSFNQGLLASLPAVSAGLNVTTFDTYALIDSVVANPAKFNFTNVTSACLTGSVNYVGGTVCSNPNASLFWDSIHPTAPGHAIVAADVLAVLVPEPSSGLLLTVAALATALYGARKRFC